MERPTTSPGGERSATLPRAPVAVVGIGCVFPGAVGAGAFWSQLVQGACAVGPVPAQRWDPATLPASAAGFAGFIADADCFDAAFFGISPKEAAALDPRQRLALQVAWWALEDAAIAPDSLRGAGLGVFVGATNGEYAGAFADPAAIEPHLGVGLSNAVIANRISHVLGTHGPSLAVDTACSASLVAVHLACRSLQAGDCTIALAGGVGLMLSPVNVVGLGNAGMLAPDGRCKSFDAAADGYGRGEGCGLVVLKRLDDALAAGDRIHAVIRGSAINHDGLSNGITAPNGLSQESLIRAALADAGVAPAAIGYVEAHGTGTLLGDPTEARALGHTLGQQAGRTAPLLIGSVKTNIGHLEAAAGIAGLAKLVLAVRHGRIPASLHYRQGNPHIDFAGLGLKVADTLTPWPEGPRLGAVSSFGFGGANAHVVVEQAPPQPAPAAAGDRPAALLLSAASGPALAALAGECAALLAAPEAPAWPAVAALSQAGRSHLRHRLALVAGSSADAARTLAEFAAGRPAPEAAVAVAGRRPPKLALLCPGQGAQRPGMARELLAHDALFRATIAEADAALGWSLADLLRDGSAAIDRTSITQPALLAIGVGLARRLLAAGLQPLALAGHSLGEYTAAVIAGGVGFADALRLVAARGRLMESTGGDGAMAAVFAGEQQVLPLLGPRLALAAVNGPQSVTLSGGRAELAQACATLEAAGIRVRPLRVATAFHSPLLEPMLEEFGALAAATPWQPLRVPVVSNLDGALLPAGHVYDAGYWVRHTREPVRFADGLRALQESGVDTALELGLLPVLGGLLQDNAAAIRCATVLDPATDDRSALLRSLAALHVAGARITWDLSRREAAAGDSLPRYPFARDRYPLRVGAPAFGAAAERVPVVPSPAAAPAPEPQAPAAAMALDPATVRARVVAIVAGLLSVAPAQVDTAAPFLELGADSLILIQAVGRIEAAFGVRIPVRAFFEDLSTIDAVCAWLLRAQPAPAAAVAAPAVAAAAALAPSPAPTPAAAPAAGAGLSDTQRAHLAQLAAAYTQRTAGSRAYAQRFRPVLADSRGSAGFRFSIKDMLYPIVGRRGAGSRVWDIDGNEYIDISMGFGVQLFGHEPEFLRAAMAESLARGIRIGPQSDAAGEVAELICELTGVERVAFCNSGTEAVMTALRLARTATGRNRVAVFRGSYHGHFDGVLGETQDDPWSASPRVAGIAPGMVADLAVFEYGSAQSLELLRSRMGEFAAVLVEPVQSRNPGLQPAAFLHALRALTQAAGTVLVFDEVLTGFRIGAGGAQAHFGVRADLVTYGKVVGGGLPVGVVAGRRELLAGIDGGLWQYGDASFPAAETTFFAGTFNKHPLVMAAARAVLTEIRRNGEAAYEALNQRTARLAAQLDGVFADAGAPVRMSRFGSLFRFVFNDNLDPFFYQLIHRGLYVWEGRNLFLSTAHSDADVTAIVERVADSVAALRAGGFIARAPAPARTAPAAPVELPLSLAQRQLATLAALSPEGSAAYTIAAALDLRGPLQVERLHEAFAALVERHDALRAGIDLQAGMQRIHGEAPFALQRRAVDGPLDDLLAAELARPLDLATPPALRATLFELAPGHAVLLVAAHHALVDGQSLQVLLEELAALYGGEQLAPPPPYAELAQRLAQAGTAPPDAAHRAFWQRTLAGAPAGIELPFARLRPPVRRFAGRRVAAELPAAALRRLEQAAARHGLSSSMALTAAFTATLRRCGAPADMVLGVPFAGREPALERAVGYCAHLLALRLDVPALASGEAVMQQVRRRFLDAIEHASYPMARIVDDLGIARDPSRPPLVNVTFNVDRVAALPVLAGVRIAPRPLPAVHSRFEIGCNVLDWQDGAQVQIDYDSELFAEADMAALLQAFVALVDRFGADLQQPFDDRAEARRAWQQPAAQPAGPDLLQRFRHAVVADPAACAVELDGVPVLDRQTLDHWSDRIADAIAGAARGPGPVVLLVERGAAMPAALLGSWKAGRPWLPLDADLPPARLALLLQLAAPSCVLVEPQLRARAETAAAGRAAAVLPLPAMPAPGPSAGRVFAVPDGEAHAYLLFTSGSTGTPKLVAVPHRAVRHYLDGIVAGLALPTGMRCAVVSTFAADLGLTAVLPALFHGGCLLIASAALARDAEGFAAVLRRAPADLLKIVPSHLEGLLAANDAQAVLPRTHLVLGGEAARPALLAALARSDRRCRVFNHFGPTETTVGVMLGEWDGGPGPIRFQRPIGATRIALLDPRDQPCAIGEPGELVIGGPALACGYVGAPAAGGSAFATLDLGDGAQRVYRTGDLAVLREDGSIELLGRRDDQVKIRGHRIEPAEIVAALTRDPAIRSAAVVARVNDSGRSALVAYVVPADRGAAPDGAALLARLRAELPEAMVPAAIVPLAQLPLTANGKLDVAALPAPGSAAAAPQPADTPASALHALLLALWSDLLRRQDITPHSDFFQCGGDSILAIQLIARLHQAGWRAKAADLYACPTLSAFAGRVRPAGGGDDAPAQGACPLLPSQLRLLERLGEWPAHFNLSVGLEPAPWVTPELLAPALLALVLRHDALRLRFDAEGGGAAQFGRPLQPRIAIIDADEPHASCLTQVQASLDPAQGRLLAAGWIEPAGSGPAALVLVVHHLVCDGISLRILLDDLRQVLLDLHAGRLVEPIPRTSSVQQWAQHLQRLAHQDSTAAELPYWQLAGSLPPPALPQRSAPADGGAATDLVAEECSEAVTLTEAQTAALLLRAPESAATVEDHLVAAVTLALGDWTGERLACVELEGHGRETGHGAGADLDLGRTVGWFSSRFPAWFDLEGVPLEQAAATVAEQRSAIPGRGFGYGVLRYLGPAPVRAALAAGTAPEISLNYLGQVHPPPADAFRVTSWSPDRTDRGAERAGALRRLHRIAIEAAVSDGRLTVIWQFNPAVHDRNDIAALAQSFARHAAALGAARPDAAAGAIPRPEPLELKT